MTLAIVLGWLRKVPWQAWALVGLCALVLGLRWHWVGVGVERCQRAQEAAEAKADVKAAGVVKQSKERVEKARQDITKDTTDAVAQVSDQMAGLDPTCPALPDGVRESVQRQVEAARDGVPKPARGGNP